MRVTVLELPATWGEPRRVLADVERVLAAGPATDLVLLPEQALSGYVSRRGDFDKAPFAEAIDGPTRSAVAGLARRQGAVVVAPLVLREADACFNAMIACDPSGELLLTYRKRHPWYPERWATPGPHPAPVVSVAGLRITIAICFDLHFLEEDAAAALDASDLLLFPSAWVAEDDERSTELPAIARRHEVAVANANWASGVVTVSGQGGSSILGANGEVLARVERAAASDAAGPRRADATLALPRRR
ncbi:hypothetical protein BH11MYX4_BH11MYX4_20000 [soil metagenome]